MSNSISSFVTAAQVITIISKVDAVDAVVDAIKTKTDIIGASVALESGGNIAAIRAKTDATPQNVRGRLYIASLSTSSSEFQEVCNVTGHGKIHFIIFCLADSTDTAELRLTMDGDVWEVVSHTGDIEKQHLITEFYGAAVAYRYLVKVLETDVRRTVLDLEFSASLLIELRRSAGSASNVGCKAMYILDGF